MKTIRSTYTYFIDRYKPETILNRLNDIDIYNIKIEGYSITFDANIKNEKFILNQFPNTIILKKQGFMHYIKKIISLSVVLSLSLSIIFFYYLKSFIFKIELNGDYPSFENELLNTLDSFNLSTNNKFPSSEYPVTIPVSETQNSDSFAISWRIAPEIKSSLSTKG